MGQAQLPTSGGSSGAHTAGLVWCLAGFGLTGGAIASAFIQVSDKTPLATSLFVFAFLMCFPTIVVIILTQLSRYGAAVRRGRGVWVPMRGPYLLGEVLVLGAAALVGVTAIVGQPGGLWKAGGWSLLVAVMPLLTFLAGLDVLNGASYPD